MTLLQKIMLCLVLIMAGCATTPLRPTRIIEVPAYTLVIMDHRTLQPAYGMCDTNANHRYVYVKYDAWSNRPHFETYGHEAWHFPEQGGDWHKKEPLREWRQ